MLITATTPPRICRAIEGRAAELVGESAATSPTANVMSVKLTTCCNRMCWGPEEVVDATNDRSAARPMP